MNTPKLFVALLSAIIFAAPTFAAPTLTGTYERKSKYEPATLYALLKPGNKVEFALGADYMSGPDAIKTGNVNMGMAHATVPVQNGIATYRQKSTGVNYTLKIQFLGPKAKVTYTGNGFGGMNVDPSGTYIKTTNASPTEADLNAED